MLSGPLFTMALLTLAPRAMTAPDRLATEQQLLRSLEIQPAQLRPLSLQTSLVADGTPAAVICHADDPNWQTAAVSVRDAVKQATGVELPLLSDQQLTPEQFDSQNVVLLGHLDNNRHVARLYHNFFVCLDVGYTGRTGYVIRSVHDPFGTGHNYVLIGGSYAEGTKRGAEAFSDVVRQQGKPGSLSLGRLLTVKFDDADRQEERRGAMDEAQRDKAIAAGREMFALPGRAQSGIMRMLDHAVRYHRFGHLTDAEAYRALMLRMMEYYATDEYINTEGLARYDRDFRDSWTHSVGITWDLLEESGVFSDEERLKITNFVLRLALECVLYQGWDRPDKLESWRTNTDIVHNHNTFPALGIYFVGNYLKRHYGVEFVDDWLAVAHGIFNGQKHSSKPLEDAAGYQWLPIIHTMVYSLAEGDHTFFDEGHAREAANVAQMVMDNAGYQAAFGDHSAYEASSGIGSTLQRVAWYYKDPHALWGAQRAVGGIREHPRDNLGQAYFVDFAPEPPEEHRGVTVSLLPKLCYDYAGRSPQYPTAPNLPHDQTFDKLAFRAGFETEDEYLLLDGFGRGTHMHFDANAIIRYAKGGVPLLVDGEYIKNAPKYHSSVVIIRDGKSEFTPAVAGLAKVDDGDETAFTRTYLTKYNGAEWTRSIAWRKGQYFLVVDEIEALEAGDFTLRCCWRPWGEARLNGDTLTVDHSPMRMCIVNADGAAGRIEEMKKSGRLPVSRYSQQVSLPLKAGESYRFVNLLHAEPADVARDMQVQVAAGEVAIVDYAGGQDAVSLTDGTITPRRSTAGIQPEHPRVRNAGANAAIPALRPLWRQAGFDPASEILPVESVSCPQKHTGKYGPVDRLIDGQVSSSTGSVMWPPGVSVAITLELRDEVEVSSVLLREWHMNESWDVGDRKLEISSDGFAQDVRPLAAPFEDAGTQRWGGNVNTLREASVGQRAKQIRLLLSPARQDSSVYLAEVEVFGVRPGALPQIRALATGQLTPRGTPAFIAASANGIIRAYGLQEHPGVEQVRNVPARQLGGALGSESVSVLWEFAADDRAAVNALACADIDRDGRDEVIYGAGNERLGLLSAEGKELWHVRPPDFRGIRPDVMTVFAADVTGDGRLEVICGCKNWQYCAYDAAGTMLWRNIIYAHSATVGCAADFDGDGKAEVVGGNAYYTLNLIDDDGKRLFSRDRLGPEQTAVAAGDVTGDGTPEILVGTDGGELICFDRNGERLWTQNVGDKATRILFADLDEDGMLEVVCAAESASVFAFDDEGEQLWHAALPDGVGDLCAITVDEKLRFVAAAGAAGIAVLSTSGEIVGMGATDGRAKSLVVCGQTAVASTDKGVLQAVSLVP